MWAFTLRAQQRIASRLLGGGPAPGEAGADERRGGLLRPSGHRGSRTYAPRRPPSQFDAAARGEAFGRAYHAKHSPTVSAAERQRRIDASSAYFLEEFAVFCCLTRRGLPVMVYPGQFSTLAEIAAGRHPQAPGELRDLTFVSLRLQGR
ncbi:hypothetical protein ACFH04_09540 [Streptomyces noboritoensis]|uniref:Uncharacterized protein n=1 Tax=Streptomyces noboritoensis TaxID=67337 RepID=A0ABV6TEU7_9ACTN